MKKELTIIALAAAMLAAGTANAQLGINAGYAPVTITNATTSGNSTTTTTVDMDGFFAGVNYNLNLSGELGLSFGLQGHFNTKTSKGSADYIVISGNDEATTTQVLLDVPVLANYSLALGSSAKLSLFAGPTISYALSGNTHVKSTTTLLGNTSTTETDYDMYGDNSNSERLDLSATFGVALIYNDFRLFGGYRFGLLDLDQRDNVKSTTGGLFFGLGYALR
ncbi:MAG: PorT family protein [Bacteroidales bacterium]|nr:PorT family protein [Bacteroidales bacterium]